mgnify:CR=1 FL=1
MSTDKQILSDLEYRGVQALLSEFEDGRFRVPRCFVARVKRIMRREYGLEVQETGWTSRQETGTWCLMPYTDVQVKLQESGRVVPPDVRQELAQYGIHVPEGLIPTDAERGLTGADRNQYFHTFLKHTLKKGETNES